MIDYFALMRTPDLAAVLAAITSWLAFASALVPLGDEVAS
jgi:hypothetical protein